MRRTHDAEPRKTPSQQRSRETVARILDAAARLLDEQGYAATTTNHVAELAGVSIGSLYQYFPNKDALLVALADRHLDEAVSAMAGRLADLRVRAPAVPEVVRSLVGLTVELNESSRLHAILFAECPRTPALAARIDAFLTAVTHEVAFHLERTGTGGGDAALRARLLVSATDAAVHEVVLGFPPGPRRDVATEELIFLITGGILSTGGPHGEASAPDVLGIGPGRAWTSGPSPCPTPTRATR
jgi:AcrR family transcriptional regulator